MDLYAIAISSSYVAVSPGASKDISIYNHNGRLLYDLSEGVDEVDDNDVYFPSCMFATGEILVSSSIEGTALCIWDMRRGVLLYRLTDLFDRSKTPFLSMQDKLPDGCDVTSMVPLYEQGVVQYVSAPQISSMYGRFLVTGVDTTDSKRSLGPKLQ